MKGSEHQKATAKMPARQSWDYFLFPTGLRMQSCSYCEASFESHSLGSLNKNALRYLSARYSQLQDINTFLQPLEVFAPPSGHECWPPHG